MGFAYQAEMKASLDKFLVICWHWNMTKGTTLWMERLKKRHNFFNFGICNIYVMSVSFLHEISRDM